VLTRKTVDTIADNAAFILGNALHGIIPSTSAGRCDGRP
jgi:hypothetical protein